MQRKENEKTIGKLEAEKAKRNAMMNFEQTAKAIMGDFAVEEMGVDSLTTAQLKPLLQWKLHGVAGKGRKSDSGTSSLLHQLPSLGQTRRIRIWNVSDRQLYHCRTPSSRTNERGLQLLFRRRCSTFLLALSRSWSRQWQALRPDRLVLQTWTLMMANV